MKIYIVGVVGSGKSTLARKMGELLDIPVYHLDEVVHEKNKTFEVGNHKRSDVEIEQIFHKILGQDNFIIEDCLRERFESALHEVDKVVFLDLPMYFFKIPFG